MGCSAATPVSLEGSSYISELAPNSLRSDLISITSYMCNLAKIAPVSLSIKWRFWEYPT